MTPRLICLGDLDSADRAVADSKPTSRRIAIVAWNITFLRL